MELRPSWEAANFAATEELPRILWDLKVHCRVQESHPLVPILSQINPIHIILPYLSKIHFNIVPPPTSSKYDNFREENREGHHGCRKASAKYSVNFTTLQRSYKKNLKKGVDFKFYIKQFYGSF
jgi:hypothetical protein